MKHVRVYEQYIKRFLDVFFALLALPFLVLIAVFVIPLIWLEDSGPILYIAKRRGLNGKIFNMYKLRSMKVNAPDIRNKDNSTFSSNDDPRVTRVGRFLRRSSIDELPQIINVLKGDMSWIGPRPTTTDRPLEEYDQIRLERLKVKPGITGYTQAYYRNNIPQDEKFKFDVEYAKNVSFILDCKIVFKTIQTVLFGRNLYTNEGGETK